MSANAVTPIPDHMQGLIPHLVCGDAAAAIDFYSRAFGAVERSRLIGPDGKLWNAQLHIGSAALMVVDEAPDWGSFGPKSLKGTPVTVHRFVADVDAALAQAVAAGATLVMPAADMFWGDRYGLLEDPFGHRWSLATHQHDLTPAQIAAAMTLAVAAMPDAPG